MNRLVEYKGRIKIMRLVKDETPITFGKYKGTPMVRVPDDYLVWLYEQDWFKKDWPAFYAYVVWCAKAIPDLILREEDRS